MEAHYLLSRSPTGRSRAASGLQVCSLGHRQGRTQAVAKLSVSGVLLHTCRPEASLGSPDALPRLP
jgi:hypothetical protein